MNVPSTGRAWLFAAGLLLAAAPAGAQEPEQKPAETPAAEAPAPDQQQLQALFMEYQQVQAELGAIQSRVLEQDTVLRGKQDALRETIEAAMLEAHPELADGMKRLETLRTELDAAEAAQDTARLQSILAEGGELQERIQAAQQEAMQRDDVARQVEAFRDDLIEGMKAVEPRTEELLARLEEIVRHFQQAQQPS